MRKSAPWMSIWDDRLLEAVRDKRGASVGELADHDLIRVSKSQVSRRCRRLAKHGLLRHLGNGVYVITEAGEQYLNEELDAAELPDLNTDDEEASA